MRGRDTAISVCAILVAAVLLLVAGSRLDYINAQRQEMKLIINDPLENAPPSLAFATVAMGAFRGLVVDILWIRADKLKEEGQFFDARQLAEWITVLQPRFPAVWAFQAWNMAYNISVTIPPAWTPDVPTWEQRQRGWEGQRWQWVRNGFELLRDKGIQRNPRCVQLYRELGWIFQHKIGGVSDDAHKFYKLQMAEMLEPLLGPADNEYFEALIAAPYSYADLVSDPDTSAIIEALKAADGKFAEKDRFVPNYLALRQDPGRFEKAAFGVIDQYRGTVALKRLDMYAKAYTLRNTWKLEPKLMNEINGMYGPVDFNDPNRRDPLDWRHPDTHAIYWAVRGLKVAAEDEGRDIDADETNTDRIVLHSLQDLYRNGKIYISETTLPTQDRAPSQTPRLFKEIFLRFDLRMFDSYNTVALATIEKYKDDQDRYESMQNGHRNMLVNALMSSYQSGHKGAALRIYNLLRKLYPRDEFNVSLEAYARKRFRDEMDSLGITDAKEQILALLRESYFRFAVRSDHEATVREDIAKQIHAHYTSQYPDQQRVDLPAMDVLRYLALKDFMSDYEFPPYVKDGLLRRMKIERPDVFEKLMKQLAQDQLKQAGQSG